MNSEELKIKIIEAGRKAVEQLIKVAREDIIKPVDKVDGYLVKSFKEEPLIGIVKYTNDYLDSQNVKKGDKVVFKPESEYEFNVDGEKLYRMFDHQITVVL